MITQFCKNSLLCISLPRQTVCSFQCFVFCRNKSVAVETKLPDNVQILKSTVSSSSASLRIKTINKAMKAYLERAKSYEDFLKVKNDEFEIGRHHLANIMGLEAGSLTQDDIDKAIQYLLPSGLFEKKARPMMKPPREMFPKEKAAQFDMSGRPFNTFFYTRKSNYNATLHKLVEIFHELDEIEDKMIARGILEPPKESRFNLGGEWLEIEEMRKLFLENIVDSEYIFLITTLERLCNHPYSFRCKDEILKYQKERIDLVSMEDIPELMYDENGRPYMEATGYRKLCVAKVIVRGNGTGKVSINGTDIFFLTRLQDREQIMYPLQFTKLLGQMDIEANVSGVGGKAQAGAIRYGIALCLRSFVPQDLEKMYLAGLLTKDRRHRQRKIYGQKGFRAKFTWKKR